MVRRFADMFPFFDIKKLVGIAANFFNFMNQRKILSREEMEIFARPQFRKPISEAHLQQYLAIIRDLPAGFDAISDHVIITDPDAHIIYANRAAEKNTGYAREEMIGKNPGDLWGGNMPKEFYDKMWQVIKTDKQPFVGEVRNKRKDGTEYWQEVHISPILWDNDDIKFFIEYIFFFHCGLHKKTVMMNTLGKLLIFLF